MNSCVKKDTTNQCLITISTTIIITFSSPSTQNHIDFGIELCYVLLAVMLLDIPSNLDYQLPAAHICMDVFLISDLNFLCTNWTTFIPREPFTNTIWTERMRAW